MPMRMRSKSSKNAHVPRINFLLTYLLPKIGFSHDEIANFVEKVYSINVPYIMPSVYTGSTKLINDILIKRTKLKFIGYRPTCTTRI